MTTSFTLALARLGAAYPVSPSTITKRDLHNAIACYRELNVICPCDSQLSELECKTDKDNMHLILTHCWLINELVATYYFTGATK